MRKNFFRTFAAAMVIGSLLTVPAYAETAVITGNRVNFRSGPGSDYYVITSLEKGTPVTVTDRSNSAWYAVSVAGHAGFVSSAYLSIAEDSTAAAPVFTPAPEAPANGSAGYINAMYVRFRSGPGSAYSVLGEYNRGKELTVIGAGDGWTACVIDGQLGYIYSQYVSGGTSAGSYPEPAQTPAVQPTFVIPQPDVTAAPEVTPSAAPVPSPSEEPSFFPTPTAVPTAEPEPTPTAAPTPAQSAGMAGYINGTYVRFRSGPGTNHSILGTYHTGKAISVTGDAGNGWYQCVIDGVTGYVYSGYVLISDQAGFTDPTVTAQPTVQPTQEPYASPEPTPVPTQSVTYTEAYITGNNVRFRSAPSMTAAVLGELFYGNQVSLITAHDGWAQVVVNGQMGYVSSAYVAAGNAGIGGGTGESEPSTPDTGGSATGQDIANYACQYVGYRYTWGGTTPQSGFDCSGLVYYVYKQFGYTLNRVAADQANNGVHVDASDLQPGDLVCFYSGSSYIGHVGIYIGGGRFVHASNSTTGVIISELSGYYVTRGFEARRIIG